MENINFQFSDIKELVLNNKRVVLSVIITLLLVISIPVGVYLAQNPQIFKSRAAEKKVSELTKKEQPESSGYIIEFQDDSVIDYQRKLIMPAADKAAQVARYEKDVLLPKHEAAKNDVLARLKTGISGDYLKVFNGVALDITEAQVNEIKKSPFVKNVYPNLKVKTQLMDSVPLIGADKVWQLKDRNGRLITGEDVKIAVIDTGIDSTHSDLGASQITERDFQVISSDPDSSNVAISSDKSKIAYLNTKSEHDSPENHTKIYVYSSDGQKLNEFSLPGQEKWVAQIVIEGNYLAYFGYEDYGEHAGVSIYDLTTGEHKRVEDITVVGTMHIYEDTLYYGTGTVYWPNYHVQDVSFAIYNIPTGNLNHTDLHVSPTDFYTIMVAFDKKRVAFPVPEKADDSCAKNVVIFDFNESRSLWYSPPEVGLILDFKGDEVLYMACNSAHFDPTGSSYYLYNTKTGSATKLAYLPHNNQEVVSVANINFGLSRQLQNISPQTSTFNYNRYQLGFIGDNVIYFKRNFSSGQIIIYDKSKQEYYRLNILLPAYGAYGKGDLICFLASGIRCHNFDPHSSYPLPTDVFNKKVISGYNFVSSGEFPLDDHGHGTHVAAIVAGNGSLKGVAPGANLIAYKVLNNLGFGFFSDVIAALEKAVQTRFDNDQSNNIDVINMSIGVNCGLSYTESCGPDDPLSRAVDNTVDVGITVVVAAGNSGPSERTIASPGTARKAITVGAVDKTKQVASFSSRGPVIGTEGIISKPDVVAPGVSICAAEWDSWRSDLRCLDDKHIAISGTSMAAPHVVGLAALIKQAFPNLSPLQIKEIIKKSAQNLDLPIDAQGSGLIDAQKSVSVPWRVRQ